MPPHAQRLDETLSSPVDQIIAVIDPRFMSESLIWYVLVSLRARMRELRALQRRRPEGR